MTVQIISNSRLTVLKGEENLVLHIKPQEENAKQKRIEYLLDELHSSIKKYEIKSVFLEFDRLANTDLRNIRYLFKTLLKFKRKFKVALMIGYAESEEVVTNLRILLSDYMLQFDFKFSLNEESNLEWLLNN